MDAIKQLLSAGQLQQAIEHAQQSLRQAPANGELRACLIELLCLAGDLERADDLLTHLVKRHPAWLSGATNVRQLLRAQQARIALRQGRLAEDVVAPAGPELEALLSLHLHLSQGDIESACQDAIQLELNREIVHFRIGEAVGPLRDCDDSLNGFLEGLGTDGRYYLWLWKDIQSVQLHSPGSPVELIWRRATIDLLDGRQGEAFLPLTYAASVSDSQKMGRETDWLCHADDLVTGLGLKLYLLGDEAVSFDGVQFIDRYPAEGQQDAV